MASDGISYRQIDAQYGDLSGTIGSQWGEDVQVTLDDKLHMSEQTSVQTIQGPINWSSVAPMTFAGPFNATSTGINTFAGGLNVTSTNPSTFVNGVFIGPSTGLTIQASTDIVTFSHSGTGMYNWNISFNTNANNPKFRVKGKGPEIWLSDDVNDADAADPAIYYRAKYDNAAMVGLDGSGNFVMRTFDEITGHINIFCGPTGLLTLNQILRVNYPPGPFNRMYIACTGTAATEGPNIYPEQHEFGYCGSTSTAFLEVVGKALIDDDGTLGSYDHLDDLAIIDQMDEMWADEEGKVNLDTHGTPIIHRNSIPDFLRSRPGEKFVRPSAIGMFALGAVKQLHRKVKDQDELIIQLAGEIRELKTKINAS